jgi:hypothetical protein
MLATHTDAMEETITEDCESTAALRYEKVRTARRRLAEGRYDRNDWLDPVVAAILNDVGR